MPPRVDGAREGEEAPLLGMPVLDQAAFHLREDAEEIGIQGGDSVTFLHLKVHPKVHLKVPLILDAVKDRSEYAPASASRRGRT